MTRCCPTNQIVRQDRSMEQIVFPVPGICQFLTEETKHRLFTTTEQDEQGSKVSDFFDQSSFLHNEMEWQRRLRSEDQWMLLPFLGLPRAEALSGLSCHAVSSGMPLIYWFSRRMTLWGSISFNLAVFINIIIAFFYPYVEGASTGEAANPPLPCIVGPLHVPGGGASRTPETDRLASWEMPVGMYVYPHADLSQRRAVFAAAGGVLRVYQVLGEGPWALGFTLGPPGLRHLAHACPLLPGVLGSPLISLLFWILICFSIAALFTKRYSVRPLIVALILRSIYYLGIGPTLNILGALNVSAVRSSGRPVTCWPLPFFVG